MYDNEITKTAKPTGTATITAKPTGTATVTAKPFTFLLLAEDGTVLTAEDDTNLSAEAYGTIL